MDKLWKRTNHNLFDKKSRAWITKFNNDYSDARKSDQYQAIKDAESYVAKRGYHHV